MQGSKLELSWNSRVSKEARLPGTVEGREKPKEMRLEKSIRARRDSKVIMRNLALT